jgi:DNA polymerase
MAATPDTDWAAQWAAAQAWWRDAGIEQTFSDTPTDWLANSREQPAASVASRRTAPKVAEGTAPAKSPIGGERSRWPATLDGFADWWLTEPSLDPVAGARRVAPAGPAAAPLMVVVAQPEPDDRERLLGGPQGRLLDVILAGFGLSRDQVYLASALPRATPLADWAELARDGMSEVLAHHIALAAPKRVLVFGRGGVSALLGHDPTQSTSTPLDFDFGRVSVGLAFAPALETLLDRPVLKAGVWARWLAWTGDE